MVCPPYKEGPGQAFAIHPSQVHDSKILTFLVLLFAARHPLDLVPKSYELK